MFGGPVVDKDVAADWVDDAVNWSGAYLHIPFCSRVCPYCDFAVVEGRDDVILRYVNAVAEEISRADPWRPLDAVFVGGGTPSHLDAGLLKKLLVDLDRSFGFSTDAEVTLEANPEDWTGEKAKALLETGFNRVSFGVQSLDPGVLAYLGRRHGPHQAFDAVKGARSAGFRSISIDLVMGSPGETLDSWKKTIEGALTLDLDHVSVYGLTVERGTPLARAVAGGAPAPDADDQADKYLIAQEAISGAGLVQYEVSNYGKPGHECRYNLVAWAQGEYVAFGLGAHGHRDGERFWNVRRLDSYLDSMERAASVVQGSERLEGREREQERLIVGLRRTAGVSAGDLGRRWLRSAEGERFTNAGIVADRDDRVVVLKPLMTDAVARSLVSFD
jgi:putative oxygen-independent coproporphyrinogen III oxidase